MEKISIFFLLNFFFTFSFPQRDKSKQKQKRILKKVVTQNEKNENDVVIHFKLEKKNIFLICYIFFTHFFFIIIL